MSAIPNQLSEDVQRIAATMALKIKQLEDEQVNCQGVFQISYRNLSSAQMQLQVAQSNVENLTNQVFSIHRWRTEIEQDLIRFRQGLSALVSQPSNLAGLDQRVSQASAPITLGTKRECPDINQGSTIKRLRLNHKSRGEIFKQIYRPGTELYWNADKVTVVSIDETTEIFKVRKEDKSEVNVKDYRDLHYVPKEGNVCLYRPSNIRTNRHYAVKVVNVSSSSRQAELKIKQIGCDVIETIKVNSLQALLPIGPDDEFTKTRNYKVFPSPHVSGLKRTEYYIFSNCQASSAQSSNSQSVNS